MKPRQRELLRATDTPQSELVISAVSEGVWILVYQGEPFQIRREQQYSEGWKYLPNCWSQRGSAERQARYLNDLFQTDQFEIAQIQSKTTR
jgi:hypothetical protein